MSLLDYASDLFKAVQAAGQIIAVVHTDREHASDRIDAAVAAMKPLPPPAPDPPSPPPQQK